MLLSFLSRIFGSSSSKKGSRDLDARLERLEREAERAAPGYVGTAYNRAGDLALREGRPEQAVGYYGRAIDAFLNDAQREAARGVANKIIRVRPSAVRTLCTLTWLDLAAKHEATALLHLRDYVDAAREAGESLRAASQVYEMARISPLSEFVGAVADALDSLDYPGRARRVRAWAAEGSPDAIEDPEALAQACLEGAVRSSDRDEELLADRRGRAGGSAEAGDGDAEADEDPGDAAGEDVGDGGSEGETDDTSDGDGEDRDSGKRRYRWE